MVSAIEQRIQITLKIEVKYYWVETQWKKC